MAFSVLGNPAFFFICSSSSGVDPNCSGPSSVAAAAVLGATDGLFMPDPYPPFIGVGAAPDAAAGSLKDFGSASGVACIVDDGTGLTSPPGGGGAASAGAAFLAAAS